MKNEYKNILVEIRKLISKLKKNWQRKHYDVNSKRFEEKEEMEHKAMADVLGNLCQKEELLDILFEFDEHKSKESKFVYLCDKIEADIQAKVYQDTDRQHSLNDQPNNVVFNNSKAKKMVEDGAQTAFDIWYEWDKEKYNDSPLFQKVLEYVKNNNTNL